MKEQLQYVDFDTAVLLKEAGMNCNTRQYYVLELDNKTIQQYKSGDCINHNIRHYCVSRPTSHLVSQWLREVKGLHVAVNLTHDGWYWQMISTITGGCFAEQSFIASHDLALSAAITNALEILKNSK